RPAAGRVRLLGHDAHTAPPALRRRVGVALDRPVHLGPLTAVENAELFARAAGLDREAADRRARAVLARLGPEAQVRAAEMSLGMARRLLLAGALVHHPEVVLLDEPTLGLDPDGVEALAG